MDVLRRSLFFRLILSTALVAGTVVSFSHVHSHITAGDQLHHEVHVGPVCCGHYHSHDSDLHHPQKPGIPDSDDDCLICRLKAEVANEAVPAFKVHSELLVVPFVSVERKVVVDEPCFRYWCRGPPTC